MKNIHSFYILFFIILILQGCAENEPVIIKKKMNKINSANNPELVETKNEDNMSKSIIEFSLPREVVEINLELIPILNQYLQSASNQEQTVKQMNLIPVHEAYDTLYLLEFSCRNESCSYILIDQSQDNNRSHLIADLSQYINMGISPSKDRVFLQFNRSTDYSVSLSDIVVVDLLEWKVMKMHNKISILNYSTPILEVKWNDNETLSLIIPQNFELNKNYIKTWDKNNNPTETVNVHMIH